MEKSWQRRAAAAETRAADLARDLEAAKEATDALDAMAENVSLELSWGEVSDYEGAPCQWQVHERTGNRNDREWHRRGVGDTPLAALRATLAQLKGTDNG